MADLALSGLASGFDWKSVVDQLSNVERAPQRRLKVEQSKINQQKEAVSKLVTELSTFQTKAEELKDTSFFSERTATSSDEAVATASTTDDTPTGTYKFEITQLATNSQQKGGTGIANKLSATSFSTAGTGPSLSSANVAATITAGTFTIDGFQVTVNASDTVGDVLARIGTATGGTVTAAYDTTTDKITLTKASGTIAVGSTADTSNFLEVMRLATGTTPVLSSTTIGRVNLGNAIATGASATFNGGNITAIPGSFKVNGVTIDFAVGDTVGSILRKISDSSAGVDASYNSLSDQIILTNKESGGTGISLADVSGDFLAAAKLTTGTLTAGNNVKFKLNGGSELTGLGNTITELHHGITGLTVNALKLGADSTSTTTTTEFQPDRYINKFDAQGGAGNDSVLTVSAHGYATGDEVQIVQNGGTVPTSGGSTAYLASNHFVQVISTTEIRLHTTKAGAVDGTSGTVLEFDSDVDSPGPVYLKHIAGGATSTSTTTISGSDSSVTITVGKDIEKIKKAIISFFDQYNKVQSLIDTQTASSTDADGKVTAGILANNRNVHEIAHTLREKLMNDVITTGSIVKRIDFLGYKSGGFSNNITQAEADALADALSTSEGVVKEFFTTTANSADKNGLAVRLNTYLESIVGDDGSLISHQGTFSKQATRIDEQITDMEKLVQANRQRMIDSFIAMEKAQQQINQQMQYLAQRFK